MITLTEIRLLAYLGLAAACFIGYGLFIKHERDIGAAGVRAEYQTAAAEQIRQNAAAAAVKAENAQKALDGYAQQIAVANTRARAASTDLGRLRNQLASVGPSASGPADACVAERERIGLLSGLLAEGAGLVEEGGRRVDALDAKVTGLQQFIGAK